jgi:hypothetical protein
MCVFADWLCYLVLVGAVRFAGTSSVAWDGLMKSDLITGDGLVTAGATPSQADDELVRINKENEKIISSMSQREILEEQKKLKESLSESLSIINSYTLQ